MKLAASTPLIPAYEAFPKASDNYKAAIASISFQPNQRIDVRAALSQAIAQTQSAVDLLTPYTTNGDMFTTRNATSSVTDAKNAISALNTALTTVDTPGAGQPQIPVATFLEIAKGSLTSAEAALWWE